MEYINDIPKDGAVLLAINKTRVRALIFLVVM